MDCNNSHGTDTMLCAVFFFFFLILMAALNKIFLNKTENTNLFLDARWVNTLRLPATCDYRVSVKSAVNAAAVKDGHLGSEQRRLIFCIIIIIFFTACCCSSFWWHQCAQAQVFSVL